MPRSYAEIFGDESEVLLTAEQAEEERAREIEDQQIPGLD